MDMTRGHHFVAEAPANTTMVCSECDDRWLPDQFIPTRDCPASPLPASSEDGAA